MWLFIFGALLGGLIGMFWGAGKGGEEYIPAYGLIGVFLGMLVTAGMNLLSG